MAAMRRLQDDPVRRAQLADSGYEAYRRHWTESAVLPSYLDIVRRAAMRHGMSELADAIGDGTRP